MRTLAGIFVVLLACAACGSDIGPAGAAGGTGGAGSGGSGGGGGLDGSGGGSGGESGAGGAGGNGGMGGAGGALDPREWPLIGTWSEEVYFGCNEGGEASVQNRIEELVFRADGTFSVTWQPFETYEDYWGSWQASQQDGSLELRATGGNYLPTDVDLEGSFSIAPSGELVLKEMWLGSYPLTTYVLGPGCGYRFTRR